MKIVFFQGSFDIVNAGHVRAFALAKSHGDILVVGLNTDELIRRDKGREPIIPYSQRKEIAANESPPLTFKPKYQVRYSKGIKSTYN